MPSDSEITVDLLAESLAAWNIVLTQEQRTAFGLYASLLVEWNSTRFNLTRLVSPEQIALNHLLDSLSVTQFIKIPHSASLIDIGTGAGFPGLALKIFRPDIKLTLLESTAKKLTFCEEVARQCGIAGIQFIHGRAEDPAIVRKLGGSADMITARAVAPLKTLLTWTLPLLASTGTFVAWKGARVHEEIAEAEQTARHYGLQCKLYEVLLQVTGLDPVNHYFAAYRFRV